MPRSPIMPAAITCSTSPEKTDASALTMLHLKLFAIAKSPWWTALLHLVGFLDGLVDGADHVEGLLRSEEHTSELQSRPHLVCRLLLEKKKTPYPRFLDRPRQSAGCRTRRRAPATGPRNGRSSMP